MELWNTAAAIIEQLLDAVMPPRERVLRLRACTQLPALPHAHVCDSLRITTLLDYHLPCVADAVHALKYDGSAHAANLLAAVLADFLREDIGTMRAFSGRPIVLVPVPLHKTRRAERGFNQVERILEQLPAEFRDGSLCRILPHALKRIRATPPQTELSRRKRLANVRNAFSANAALVSQAHVYIIDDVATTGATLSACVAALAASGAHTTAIALAHA